MSYAYRTLRLTIFFGWLAAGMALVAYVSLFQTWTGIRILSIVFFIAMDVPVLLLLRKAAMPRGETRTKNEDPLGALNDEDPLPVAPSPVILHDVTTIRQAARTVPKERFIKVRYNADFFAKIRVEDSEVDESTVKLVRIEEDKPAEA